MFLDGAELADGAPLEADLCIVGAGPAGLAVAREFLGRRERVIVLEAGGEQVSRRSQSLYRAEMLGAPNHAATHSRFRVYGGSGTRWTGQCVPFEAIDFEHRDEIPDSGWPFDLAHLRPWYARAGELFGFGADDFSLARWRSSDAGVPRFSGDGSPLETSIIRFAHPHDLGERLRAALAASPNVDVVLDANAVDIVTDESLRRVTGVLFRGASGRRFECRARRVVLAAGGIENPRLLLASRSRAPCGLGNEHDQVGRWFLDHPYLTTGYWTPSAGIATRGLHVVDDFSRVARERGAHSVLTLAPAVRRREGLAGCVGYFIGRESWQLDSAYHAPGGRALVHLAELLRGERAPDTDLADSLRALGRDPRSALATARAARAARRRPRPRLALRTVLEATPCRDSRVTLGGRPDALGLPRARVDWRIEERDWRGLARFREELARLIRARGLGELVDDHATDARGWPLSMSGGKHHMGTTRMHEDPTRGVVDVNARVHSLANLYVAGSSVFPTGGWANPTFTIIALAIRLADHLKSSPGAAPSRASFPPDVAAEAGKRPVGPPPRGRRGTGEQMSRSVSSPGSAPSGPVESTCR